jgi:regulator of protease activity HflC (stomatin/prohibitin superfamily)
MDLIVVRSVRVRAHERGLVFRNKELRGVLQPGLHWIDDPLREVRVDVVSVREPLLRHADLDVIVKAGLLGSEASVVDLKDHERAIVFVDGRVRWVLKPGLYALWTVFHDVRVEVVDARPVRFDHDSLHAILAVPGADALEAVEIAPGFTGLFFKEGRHETSLPPGTHALWKGVGRGRVVPIDLREQVLDVAGQEIMTADKVTLRLNAVLVFRVQDALAAVTVVDDHRQALYREAQLALRAVVGTRELDALLSDKDAVARELHGLVEVRAASFGLSVVSLGIRDVVLPGEMKDLLNKVTEARKAAEAHLIMRREEVAAVRSQANTAHILESSPTLMRLRELEALEKVASAGKLSVVVGDKGLTDLVVKLL